MWLHCPAVRKGSSRKLHRPWQGPYVIVKVIGDTVYRIQHLSNPRKGKVVHYNCLKHSNDNQEGHDVIWEKVNLQQQSTEDLHGNLNTTQPESATSAEPGSDQTESSGKGQNNQSEGMQ